MGIDYKYEDDICEFKNGILTFNFSSVILLIYFIKEGVLYER